MPKQEFPSGSLRDISKGKPRPDLIPTWNLWQLGRLYSLGCDKYGERNWEKGQPVSRFLESAWRHFLQIQLGDTSEDHFSAVVFNIFGAAWVINQVYEGKLPEELVDTEYAKEFLRNWEFIIGKHKQND